MAFISSISTPATSTDMGYYNTFVTNAANLDYSLASVGTTWTAIASTNAVNARDNTNTNPASAAGVPIYGTVGQLIATSNSDLWDGSISAPIIDDEHGVAAVPGYTQVWSGTSPTGAPEDPEDPLGNEMPSWGDATSKLSNWIDTPGGYYPADGYHTLYALSALLTVVAGDVNRDGIVNSQDIALVSSTWLTTGGPVDIDLVSANWLKCATDWTTTTAGTVAPVPEPAAIILVAMGSLTLLRRRTSGRTRASA